MTTDADLTGIPPATGSAGSAGTAGTAVHDGQAEVSFVDLFLAQAADRPDAAAVESPGRRLTYGQLAAESTALARALHAVAGPGQGPVAVLTGYTVAAVVALLGVQRSGRPVVVLDPAMPADRLRVILGLSGATTLLVDEESASLGAEVGAGHAEVVALESLFAPAPGSAEGVDVVGPVAPESVAAILFTSGSSGLPKGVVWSHALLGYDAVTTAQKLHYRAGDRVAMALPISFAAGLIVVAVALASGASLHLRDPRKVGSREFLDWTVSTRATLLHTTPSLLRGLVRAMGPTEVFADLRVVSACGETLFARDVESVRPHLSADCWVTGWFGSSEGCSLAFVDYRSDDPLPESAVPAGWANTGRTIAVWDDDDQPVATGVAGHVVVVSRHMSSGYLDDPERTAAKFTDLGDGTWLLRTGDVGALDGSGCLRLLGRSEAAVKIGGYFVDPSEIESALLASGAVADAAVVAQVQGVANRLVAYVTPVRDARTPSAAFLRAAVAAKLPSWMVPSHVVVLTTLPRNERGKVDRAALPPVPAREPVPLQTPLEEQIASVWCQVLGVTEVGRDDDFLELGGDSLAAEEMLVRVEKLTGVAVRTSDFTQAPVLSAFAERVAVAATTRRRGSVTTVEIRPGTDGRTVFCVAGAGGSAVGFLPLAARLPASSSVVVFQARGFEGRDLAEWSLERMARRRMAEIVRIQPTGPYTLVGHSMGALLALRIAHLLRADRREVGLLVLVDPFIAESAARRRFAAQVRREAAAARAGRSAAERRRELVSSLRTSLVLPLAGLVQLGPARQEVLFFRQGGVVSRRHLPEPWTGPVLAYRSTDNTDPQELWDWLLPGVAVPPAFPCTHTSVVREPYVGRIAADVVEALGWDRPGVAPGATVSG